MNAKREISESIARSKRKIALEIAVARAAKPVLRRLRNHEVTCTTVWGDLDDSGKRVESASLYIYLVRRVISLKSDISSLLAKIDGIPGEVNELATTGGWSTTDTEGGERLYTRVVKYHNVRISINLTAIPKDDGLCRKVVVGERVETVRSPIYEIICPE